MSTPTQRIRRDVRVFVSAVTRELASARKIVKKGLEDNDYHAVEQDSFPPDYRDFVDKLRARIASCDAVVHIAGYCYGAEPKNRPENAPRRSYTQLEYDIAMELTKPVYVFLTSDGFPADPHESETGELKTLQESHRRSLTSTGRDYSRLDTVEELDQKIRSLQMKVERLEHELSRVDAKVTRTGRWLWRRRKSARSSATRSHPVFARLEISAYYPKETNPEIWRFLYAYVFRPGATEIVEADARELLGDRFGEYRRRREEARSPVRGGAVITVTPNLGGFQFNPPIVSVELHEEWHRLDFRLRARAELTGKSSNGTLTFGADGVIVGDIPLSIYVGELGTKTETVHAAGRLYQSIFCSYSHRDRRIAQRVESVCRSLGIDYLRDVIALRSGQHWRDELAAMIQRADVFQLFWSRNAAQSEYVEQEWRHALKIGRASDRFIRPVYWTEPMTSPPSELQHLHFAFAPELAPWFRRCISRAYRFATRCAQMLGRA
jgi:uncharacterized small protein (DUF1192 family)